MEHSAHQLTGLVHVRQVSKDRPVKIPVHKACMDKIVLKSVTALMELLVALKQASVFVLLAGKDINAIDHATKEHTARIAKRNAIV